MKKIVFKGVILFFGGMWMQATPVSCVAQTIYSWNGPGTGDWTIAANWTPARITPAANDILQFSTGAVVTLTNVPTQAIAQLSVSAGTTVNIQSGGAGNVLTIGGAATGDDLVVAQGATLNINGSNDATIYLGTGATANISGNISFSAGAHRLDAADAQSVMFNSPAVFTQDAGCGGNVFTASGTANAIVFNAGAVFVQKAGGNPFALTQPHTKVLFNKGSLFKVQQVLFLSFSGRNYADLEIDYPGFNQSALGVNAMTVDNLTVSQGTLSLNLTGGVNVTGNINVASGATLNFNPASAGSIYFKGSTTQTISHTGNLNFNNNTVINFNNAAGFLFNNDVVFNNSINFNAGVITMANGDTMMLGTSAVVNNMSDASFVDGLVKKTGNTAFIFPVGKIGVGYVPVGISAPGSITDAFTAAYLRSAASALSNNYAPGLDHVSGVDYWILSRNSGTTPVDVTLYWTNASSANGSALYINNIGRLVIAQYNGSTAWYNYGGVYNTGSGFAAGSITWPGVNNFNIFSLGSTDMTNPLPVTLEYFNGSNQQNKNYFNCKVTCTTNCTVSLQRSRDASNFTNIQTIFADSLNCIQPFVCTDDQPLEGINYYRLKITAPNAAVSYSAVILLRRNNKMLNLVSIVPGVVTGKAMLKVSAAQSGRVKLVITDIAGRQLFAIPHTLKIGANTIEVDLSSLSSGIYQITGYTSTGLFNTVRFIKQ